MKTNNYWSSCLYPIFLSALNSCTLASYTDEELQDELSILARKAIAKFKFPKVDLTYEEDPSYDEAGIPRGYRFVNDVTFKEILVLVEWMKVFWLEYQLSKERNYENLYADKDVKAFSSGNLIQSIVKAFEAAHLFARKTEEDYERVNVNGRPAIGDINV